MSAGSDCTPFTVGVGAWTVAGGPDPDFNEAQRTAHHLLLTDERLLTCFRQRFPEHRDCDYDEMIRLLDFVWECAHDGTVNVSGFLCARCGETRAAARRRSPPAIERHDAGEAIGPPVRERTGLAWSGGPG
jgi:hypothetical protein